MSPFIQFLPPIRTNPAMHARFYHPEKIATGQYIELSDDNKHHAARVLRLKAGDTVTLFTGQGGEFSAQIEAITKSRTTVLVQAYHETDRESPLTIELAQAVCVNEKMDWIIQKAVELGVSRIQPLVTTRSIVHLSDERAAKRLQHWQKIIISACEQCGRNRLPEIFPLVDLPHWLSQKKASASAEEIRLLLSTRVSGGLKQIPQPSVDACVIIGVGPEGGFTPEEEIAMLHTHFTPLRLGQRIFRTETAALATVAAIQALWGDY